MKKFVVFMLVLTTSTTISAQTKEEVEGFTVTRSEKVILSHTFVQEFFKQTDFAVAHKDVQLDANTVELVTLQNNAKGIKILLKNQNFNILVAVKMPGSNKFVWFLLNNQPDYSELFSPDRTLLLKANNVNGVVEISYVAEKRSKFGQCMAAVEADFEDTYSGWLFWNLNPLAQVTAATMCATCTSYNVGCPAAYQP